MPEENGTPVIPATSAVESAEKPAIVFPPRWQEIVGAFAEKVGLKIEDVSSAFNELVGEPSDEALGYLADVSSTPDADIKEVLGKFNIPRAKLTANIAILRGPKKVEAASAAAAAGGIQNFGFGILPNVPDDESFTRMLKTGGELKIGATEVLAAVKSALANRVKLFDLPEILKKAMEKWAESNDEPCTAEYFKLRNLVTKRKYSEVLSVLEVEGTFVTDGRKANLFSRLDQYLWPSLIDFKELLINWQKTWLESVGGQAMTAMVYRVAAGQAGSPMPNMMVPPETDGLRDSAEDVINKINKVFAGPNIPVVRALAYDAGKIKEILETPGLPAMIGAANKEQMLKMLGTDVASDYPRLEKNIVRFIMAIMEIKNITGPEEVEYFQAMAQLAGMIPWEKLMRTGKVEKSPRTAEKY